MISDFFNKLNPNQKEAVNIEKGPALVVAGAGSGKTRALICRLIKLLQDGVLPENIVAITFTNKAAEEIKHRVTMTMTDDNDKKLPPNSNSSGHSYSQGLFVGTFHSFCAKLLREIAHQAGRNSGFAIFDNSDSDKALKKVLLNLKIDQEKYSFGHISHLISRVKNDMISIEELGDMTEEKIYRAYEESLEKQNAFDFDDLIQKVVLILKEHPNILQRYQKQYQYFLIDEYQDVNQAQYQLVKLLVSDPGKLWVVGDDQQAIYGFRFADFRNFLNFEKDWPNTKTIVLDQNYRSTRTIIESASAFIKHNKLQKSKNLWTENEGGNLIKIVETNNPEEEAEWVMTQINQDWNKFKETAIFYRTNAQSRVLEEVLLSRNIPYRIFGAWQFYERQEIKDILSMFRYAYNPRDEVSRDRILKFLPKKVAIPMLDSLPDAGKKLNLLKLVDFILRETDYLDLLDRKFKNAAERRENIHELLKLAANYNSLAEFLERTALASSIDLSKTKMAPPKGKYVHLMTIHMAKGLEFDQVFVAGANEGMLPHQMCYNTFEGIEEERRLMYVAMTRARKELALSFYYKPSRFLYELPPEFVEFFSLKNSTSLPSEEEVWLDY